MIYYKPTPLFSLWRYRTLIYGIFIYKPTLFRADVRKIAHACKYSYTAVQNSIGACSYMLVHGRFHALYKVEGRCLGSACRYWHWRSLSHRSLTLTHGESEWLATIRNSAGSGELFWFVVIHKGTEATVNNCRVNQMLTRASHIQDFVATLSIKA